MRSKLLSALLVALLFLNTAPVAQAAVKVGSTCTSVGKTQTVSGVKLICKVVNKKKIWQKAPVPVAPSGLTIKVLFAPEFLGDPGMLNDPLPEELQDQGMNSSIIVEVTKVGRPVNAAQISLSTSDQTANFQFASKSTDYLGRARGWLINGASDELKLTFSTVGASAAAEVTLKRTKPIKATSGRPVIATFEPLAGKNYDQVIVEATPNTAPVGTYYAFANFENFYTGVQSVLCNGWDMYELVCNSQRGLFNAREGHLSVWNGVDAQGVIKAPQLVSKSPQTKCSPFDHEGNGLMCIVAFDWQPGDKIQIAMKKIAGAPAGFFRLDVTAINLKTNTTQNFAIVDVPVKLNLSQQFATFNEHYIVASAKSCLDIEERSITVNSVRFIQGAKQDRPAKLYVYGNLVAPEATLCENYGYESTSNGLEVFSGGKGRFVPVVGALRNGSFGDLHQSKLMLRYIPLASLSTN